MIEKVLTIASLDEDMSVQDLVYWLGRPSEERLAAVQLLRERVFDLPQPVERILEIEDRVPLKRERSAMRFETDFEDVIRCLNQHSAEFLLVGAHALAHHGVPRAQDLDLYIRPTPENARRVVQAVESFGFSGLDEQEVATPGKVIMMGRPPMRIDLLTRISGVIWDEAWVGRVPVNYGQQSLFVIGKQELIANKAATGRTKDKADWELLQHDVGQKGGA